MPSKPSLEEPESRIKDLSLEFGPNLMRQAGYRVLDWIVGRQMSVRSRIASVRGSIPAPSGLLPHPLEIVKGHREFRVVHDAVHVV